MEMVGVLPTGRSVQPPRLIAAHDMQAWIQQQMTPPTRVSSKSGSMKSRSRNHRGGHSVKHVTSGSNNSLLRGGAKSSRSSAHSSSSNSSEVGDHAGIGTQVQQQQQQEEEEEAKRSEGEGEDEVCLLGGESGQGHQQKLRRHPKRGHKDGEKGDIKLELAMSW